MPVHYSEETIDWSCGLSVIGAFYKTVDEYYTLARGRAGEEGGTGFFIAAFINTENCRAAYEELIKNYRLVFQSPVRMNVNSNNDFFFCVFDRRKDATDVEGLKPPSFPEGMHTDYEDED